MPTDSSDGPSDKKTSAKSGASNDGGASSASERLKNGEDGAQRESTPTERTKERTTPAHPSSGDVPSSPGKSEAPAQNTRADGSPASSSGASSPSGAVDRWGDLPVYARDVFRAEGGADFPSAYREFIDAYYRRLNRRR